MVTILHALGYVAAVAALLFVTLSLGECSMRGSFIVWLNTHDILASGLLWLSEIIEEHSRLAKYLGMRAVYVRVPNLSLSGPVVEYSFACRSS